MKTPSIYNKNIKNKIITDEMVALCLYSVNKRAKNYRDKEREYSRWRYLMYNYEEDARQKKEEYYAKKDKLLTLLKPLAIHKQEYKYNTCYFYYYEIGGYSFHSPITAEVAEKSNLETTELHDFYTYGKDVVDLISCQFVDKVLALIDTGDYTLHLTDNEIKKAI